MGKSWKIMKSVIGTKRQTNKKKLFIIINNKKCDNDLQIANEFNNYFVSVGQTLEAKLPPASLNRLISYNPIHIVWYLLILKR